MNLPTTQQCLELFQKYKVPKNILKHCQQVQKIAVFLTKKLQQKDINLNPELIQKAALLHDFLKVVSLDELDSTYYNYSHSPEEIQMHQTLRKKYPRMNEAEAAHFILKDDYPELALLIKNFGNPQKTSRSWEEIILLYSDARILRNRIVSLDQRKSYIKQAYSYPDVDSFFQKIKNYEQKLMNLINLEPENLAQEIEK